MNTNMNTEKYAAKMQKRKTDGSTGLGVVLDHVFQTVTQEMRGLLLPLAAEMFGISDLTVQEAHLLQHDHREQAGEFLIDSCVLLAGGYFYQLKCLTKWDGDMDMQVSRYGFSSMQESPRICILEIRDSSGIRAGSASVQVHLPDGREVITNARVLHLQDYTVHDLFEKKLVALLPYYILRHERFLTSDDADEEKIGRIMAEVEEIDVSLKNMLNTGMEAHTYTCLSWLIREVAEHLIPAGNQALEAACRIGVQRPRIESDISTKNIADEHILELYYSCIQDGDMLPERAAKRLNISVPELRERMQEQGYYFPE